MDPITFALILGAAFWVTDTASSGLLRAEVGGGLSGAFGGAGRKWWERRKTTHERRAKRRSKSKAGRAVNAVFDEATDLGRSFFGGWPEGRTRAHERRRQRWQAKPPWWKRYFGPSDPEGDEPEGPEGSDSEPEGSGPEKSERDPWGDSEPIRTSGSKPETFRLDVTTSGGVNSGGFGSRLPKGEAISAAIRWAEGIMKPLSDGQDGTLYRTTGGADEHIVTLNGQRGPDQPAPSSSTQGGSTVADLTTAPAVIAAWEEIRDQFEELESRLDELATDAETARDGGAAFEVGGEGDAATLIRDLADDIVTAKEKVGTVVDDLHEEWDGHIEAAASGGTAEAHEPFQEV